MKVYIFIETDSNESTYAYTEVFYKEADAVKRLTDIYHEEAVERVEAENLVKAWISDDHKKAWVEYEDVSINWQIQEKEVIMPEKFD